MKTLPRHIEEHAKHCDECQRRRVILVPLTEEQQLCSVGLKLLADWKTIAARIDKLPKLSEQ
jgi:hypothetical protein